MIINPDLIQSPTVYDAVISTPAPTTTRGEPPSTSFRLSDSRIELLLVMHTAILLLIAIGVIRR